MHIFPFSLVFIAMAVLYTVNAEPNTTCACCGHTGLLINHYSRPACKCANCNSFERHRSLCLLLKNETIFKRHFRTLPVPARLIYFGPFEWHYNYFMSKPEIYEFFPVDMLLPTYHYPPATKFADISNLSNFRDNYFDVLISLHVLEHVFQLEQAITEIRRVIKSTGYIILEVPCSNGDTIDCRNLTKVQRIKQCHQHDHVWSFNCSWFYRLVTIHGLKCRKLRMDGVPGVFSDVMHICVRSRTHKFPAPLLQPVLL